MTRRYDQSSPFLFDNVTYASQLPAPRTEEVNADAIREAFEKRPAQLRESARQRSQAVLGPRQGRWS